MPTKTAAKPSKKHLSAKKPTAKPKPAAKPKAAAAAEPKPKPRAAAAPLVARDADLGADAATGVILDISAASDIFSDLRSKLAPNFTPDNKHTAYLASLVSDADALGLGKRHSSDAILVDAMPALQGAVPCLLQAPYQGFFGPKDAYYLLTLLLDLTAKWNDLQATLGAKAGASTSKTLTVHDGQKKRAIIHRVISHLVPLRDAQQHEIDTVAETGARSGHQIGKGLQGLGSVTSKILARAKKEPGLAACLVDRGVGTSLINEASALGKALVGTSADHTATSTELQALYDDVNILDGRVIKLLELLQAGARAERGKGRNVPSIRYPHIKKTHVRHASPPPAPPPAPPGGST